MKKQYLTILATALIFMTACANTKEAGPLTNDAGRRGMANAIVQEKPNDTDVTAKEALTKTRWTTRTEEAKEENNAASWALARAQERLTSLLIGPDGKMMTAKEKIAANEQEMASIYETLRSVEGAPDDSEYFRSLLSEYERLHDENEEILQYDGILRTATAGPDRNL